MDLAADRTLSPVIAEADGTGLWPPSVIRVVPTQSVGVPVHAVLSATDGDAPAAVLDLLCQAPDAGVLVTFVNPGTAKLARDRAEFARSLHAFDLVLPDGIGMCAAMRLIHGLPARRVSFDMTSLAPAVLAHAQANGLTVALIGGGGGVAEQARQRLAEHFPELRVTGCFDGYRDAVETVREIAALRPNIIICGMGAGPQEAFLLQLYAAGWRGWGFTCGGFFDQLQTRLNYYPGWVDRANLRWAYRLIREPRRLWRRYLLDYPQFGLMVCAALTQRIRYARTDP